MQRGYLFLIGGAESKNGDNTILKHVIEMTKAANIVIIPTASCYPKAIHRDYDNAFKKLGITETICLDIRHAYEADRKIPLAAVEQADLIYFSGGDQVRLVSRLVHTKLFDRIQKRFASGSLHIAGTSAGAAAAGNPMIYDGDYKGFFKGSIGIMRGFGLIDNITIDTHFSARSRLPRLSQFLISGKCDKGIGLDENTGIMLAPNDEFEVIGTDMVTVLNSMGITGSNYHTAGKGHQLCFNNMQIGFLPPGTQFSIREWAILN
jgi:cyanophycinase